MSMARFTCCCALLLALAASACSDDSTPDLPDEVSAEVGEKGGTLKAKGITLEIPAGALDKTVEISAKNVSLSAPKEVGAKQVSDMYEFGPEGTKFNKEVKVTFDNKNDEPKAEVYFTKEDSDEFEKIASEKGDKVVTAHVKHFSKGFLGVPLDDLDAGDEDAGEEDAGEMDAGEEDAGEMDGGTDAEPDAEEADAELPPDAERDEAGPSDAGSEAEAETGPLTTHVVVHSRDRFGVLVNQTWAAFQDGQGAWQALSAPGTTGIYQFDVAEPSFAIAFVCSSPDRVDSWNTLTYAASTNNTLDVVTQGPPCTVGPAPAAFTLQGSINMGSGNPYLRYGTSHESAGISFFGGGAGSYIVSDLRQGEQNDVVFAAGPSTDAGPSGYAISRFLVRRDVLLTGNTTQPLDMVKDGADAGVVAQAEVLNANEITDVDVRYLTRDTDNGLSLIADPSAGGDTTRTIPFTTLPASIRDPADRYLVEGSYETQYEWRKASFATDQSGNLSVSLPAPFSVVFASLDTPYRRPSFNFTPVAGASVYRFSVAYSPNRSSLHAFEIEVQPGWIQSSGSQTLTFPDFSHLQGQGFELSWVAPTEDSVDLKAAVYVQSSDVSGVFKSESGLAATEPPPILTAE